MYRFLPLVLVNLLCTSVIAAVPNAVSFYRSQQSLFPSGQAARSDLEAQIVRKDNEQWWRIAWNDKQFEIPADAVVRDLDVLDQKDDKEDLGVFLPLTDTFLRKEPKGLAEVITTIPRRARLKALGYEKNYIRVAYQGHIGFVDLGTLVCRGDFAMWAFHKTRGWVGISYRENAELVTVDKKSYALTEFMAFSPYRNRGVISQRTSESGPSIRSRVEIVEDKSHAWALSRVQGHGEVWWKMNEDEMPARKVVAKILTTEELMKRELNAVAFTNSKDMKGLASARGVFRTDDGKTWTKLEMFGDQDYPVTIHPDGIWFVGSYRSFDKGKTFEPFIRWDKLAERLQSSLFRPAKHLRITKIEALSHSRVRLWVDTGSQKVKLQAHVLSHEWTITQ